MRRLKESIHRAASARDSYLHHKRIFYSRILTARFRGRVFAGAKIMKTWKLFLAVLSLAVGSAFGQSFNVDIGTNGTGPTSDYGAAGLPGFWNSIRAEHISANPGPHPNDYFLKDIAGTNTNVRVHQFGGMGFIDVSDPSISGNDAKLLGDAILTHSVPLKSCLYFNNLAPGLYEVLTYAWMPNHPEVDSVVFHDFTPGTHLVGGPWNGEHEEGVTFARHLVTVTTGFMGPHAGLPNGGNTAIGGPLNGMQLHLVGPPGDVEADGDVDDEDAARFTGCLIGPGDEAMRPICVEYDFNHDEDVDMRDFVSFQNVYTGPTE